MSQPYRHNQTAENAGHSRQGQHNRPEQNIQQVQHNQYNTQIYQPCQGQLSKQGQYPQQGYPTQLPPTQQGQHPQHPQQGYLMQIPPLQHQQSQYPQQGYPVQLPPVQQGQHPQHPQQGYPAQLLPTYQHPQKSHPAQLPPAQRGQHSQQGQNPAEQDRSQRRQPTQKFQQGQRSQQGYTAQVPSVQQAQAAQHVHPHQVQTAQKVQRVQQGLDQHNISQVYNQQTSHASGSSTRHSQPLSAPQDEKKRMEGSLQMAITRNIHPKIPLPSGRKKHNKGKHPFLLTSEAYPVYNETLQEPTESYDAFMMSHNPPAPAAPIKDILSKDIVENMKKHSRSKEETYMHTSKLQLPASNVLKPLTDLEKTYLTKEQIKRVEKKLRDYKEPK